MNHQLLDTAIIWAGILAFTGFAIGWPKYLDHRRKMRRLRDHADCDEQIAHWQSVARTTRDLHLGKFRRTP